jgi:hypothetical protein
MIAPLNLKELDHLTSYVTTLLIQDLNPVLGIRH